MPLLRTVAFSILTLILPSSLVAQPLIPQPPVHGAPGTASVTIPPDHGHVYAADRAGTVTTWTRDASTGALDLVRTTTIEGTFAFLHALDDRTVLHIATNFGQPNSVLSVYDRDPGTGALTERFAFSDFADQAVWGTCNASVSGAGRYLHLAICSHWPGDTGEGGVVTLALDPDTGRPRVVEDLDTGSVRSILTAPDERFVITLESGDALLYGGPDLVRTYARDPDTGTLSLRAEAVLDEQSNQSLALALSSDGRHLYALSDSTETGTHRTVLYIYALTANGLLQRLARLPHTDPGFESLASGGTVSLTPDGQWLLINTRTAVVAFGRDPASGMLSHVQTLAAATTFEPPHTALDPSGSRLYRFDASGGVLDRYAVACTESRTSRCLANGRFHLTATWATGQGRVGLASSVDATSSRSALFSFFADDNWELLTKVIDACARNDHFWTFGAATTNVGYELRVTDTWTGTSRVYANRVGVSSPAVTDGRAFATCDAPPLPAGSAASTRTDIAVERAHPGDDCGHDDPDALCLIDERYQVTATWRDFAGRTGSATAVPLRTDRSGLLWFFAEDNWEMLVKIIDGCLVNDHRWFFAAGTTNVAYTLTVTDTHTGASRTYDNPLGTAAPAITDARAFACEGP